MVNWQDAAGAIHQRLFHLRYTAHARAWPAAEPALFPDDGTILLSGFFSGTLGIGSAGDMTGRILETMGYRILRDDIKPLQRRLLTRIPAAFDISQPAGTWIVHANPPEARMALFARDTKSWKNMYRIAYWTWESSLAPADWLEVARWFHEIWIPSAFVRDAFAQAFAQSPWAEEATKLHVMPHVVGAAAVPVAAAESAAPVFTALTLFDPRSDPERKNPKAAIEAWLRAFPQQGPARLIVKTLPEAEQTGVVAELCAAARGREDIIMMTQDLSRSEMNALIASCDLMISLHRCEGFGLALAEAMAAGVTVLATGWSGNMTFMTSENALLVPYALVPANRRHNGPRAQWAEPDISTAASLLKRAAADANLRARLGTAARQDITKLTSCWWDRLANDRALLRIRPS